MGGPVGSVRRAWQTAVLKAHGHTPSWIWTRKKGPNEKGSTNLSPESKAAYRAIDLHFHDLRHEGGSRLIEGGWPVHHVQHMLGHASLQQTSTYLNTTLHGLHQSMRTLEQSRHACTSLAPPPSRGLRPAGKQTSGGTGKSVNHSRMELAGSTGLEPAASGVTGRRSNQLNYDPEELASPARLRTRVSVWWSNPVCGAKGWWAVQSRIAVAASV